MSDCIFCKIIAGKIPTQRLHEDEHILVIPDKFPKANIHLLVLTRQHIASLNDINIEHDQLMSHIMRSIPKIAKDNGLTEGFRTILNTGVGGGQEIYHIHFHVLGKVRS